ncbi:cardiolipin synthase [Flavobacteriaceae bacterium F08102]|nr:cardiolipin synthase [Flavobacteriaceae bacterium F08102]
MSPTFLILYIIINICAIISIVLYGSQPSKSLGWLLIIIGLPFAGVLFYVMFGINRREFKIFTLKDAQKRKLYDQTHQAVNLKNKDAFFTSKKQSKIATMVTNSCGYIPHEGNEVTILSGGQQTFDKIFEVLALAKKFIHVQYYIIDEGELFDKFIAIFKEKIAEGVEVRVIYDAIGSISLKRSTVKILREIGVEIYALSPLKFGSILFTLNYRNHRKILIVDGHTGFTGGVNISDKYIKSNSKLGVWDDEHICLEGPVVNSLHKIFIKDFYFASNQKDLSTHKYLVDIPPKGNKVVQIVSSGPDSKNSSIMQHYMAMINLAEKQILIANPYFIPSRPVLESIKMAALSGVKVHILVPKYSDSKLAKNSMFSYFTEMLSVGVMIHLSEEFLHSKFIAIDHEIVSVGSGNFDHRSFEQNFEANALIYNAEIAKKISTEFLSDCDASTTLTLEEHQKRPLFDKFVEGLARLFSPLL